MPLDRRGQVATEFMLYTTVFIFVAVAAFVIVNQLQSAEIPLQQNTVAKETGEAFVTIITLSVKAGDGFSYTYTFPKTLFERPYRMYMTNLSDGFMVMEWEGPYGNFSYAYDVPLYNYELDGCVEDGVLVSTECSNVLTLNNDEGVLTIAQSG